MGAKEGQRKGVKEIIFYAYLIQSVSTPFPMFVIKYPEKKHPKKEVFLLAYHGREGMAAAAGGWLLHCF